MQVFQQEDEGELGQEGGSPPAFSSVSSSRMTKSRLASAELEPRAQYCALSYASLPIRHGGSCAIVSRHFACVMRFRTAPCPRSDAVELKHRLCPISPECCPMPRGSSPSLVMV